MSHVYRSATNVKAWIVALYLCIAPQAAISCLWDYEQEKAFDMNRRENVARKYIEQLRSGKNQPPSDEVFDRLRREAYEGDFRAKSDFAVALIRRGDVAQAIEILQEIERQHPGEYIVAANLGTAFELANDAENALKWISIGLRRNPESHFGSEWLHVKILEAKIAVEKEPAWLKSNSILGIEVGEDGKPTMESYEVKDLDGHAKSLGDARSALEYQLRERLSLVPPPDDVVANLLCDLAAILVCDRSPDLAISVYQLAATYSPNSAHAIDERIKRLSAPAKAHRPIIVVAPLGLSAAALVGAIGFYLKQRFARSGKFAT